VVTNDCSSLPEFAGPLAHYADALNSYSLTAALRRALAEPREKREADRRRFAQRFRWSDVAERAAQALEEQLHSRLPRERLALATAGDAEEASPFEGLVSELARHFDVEIVVPDDHPGIRPALQCVAPMIRVSQLRERHRMLPFDRFLYDGRDPASRGLLARLTPEYPGMLIDGPAEAPAGVVARAAWSAERWAELRPVVDGPLFLLDSPDGDSRQEGGESELGAIVARLAEALATLP
jgi:hypothetical protein